MSQAAQTVMNEQWERVVAVFESAVDRTATERASLVQQACAGDDDLRRQVESLLAEAERPGMPVLIDSPVGEVIAELLVDNDAAVVGTQLGPYRIESLLGVGGMGEVCCGLSSKTEPGSSGLGRSRFSRTSRRGFRTGAANSFQRLARRGPRSR